MQDHDTIPNGQAAGRIHATNTELVKFLADIREVTKGILEDGHCPRRALGKLWDKQPGQVIWKTREGDEHLRLHQDKLMIESVACQSHLPSAVRRIREDLQCNLYNLRWQFIVNTV
jgi:hypothetical protein